MGIIGVAVEKLAAARKMAGDGIENLVKACKEFLKPPPTEFSKVLGVELEAIRKRRSAGSGGQAEGGSDGRLPEFGEASPTFRNVLGELKSSDEAWRRANEEHPDEFQHTGLVGLALSGGGIRSATFNLGVLQVLDEAGIFGKLDYLSTVSGGGYIGCCLNSLYSSGQAEFPFRHQPGEDENQWFKHLREYSNYLAPHGLIDRLRMPMLFLRGLVLNFFLILPLILAAAALYVIMIRYVPGLEESFRAFLFTSSAVVAIIIVFLGYPLVERLVGFVVRSGKTWGFREAITRSLGIYLGMILMVAFIELQPHALDAYRYLAGIKVKFAAAWADLSYSDIVGALVGLFTAISAIAGAKRARSGGKVTGNIALYLLGILGPLLLWLVFILFVKWALYPDTGTVEKLIFEHSIDLGYLGGALDDRVALYLLAAAVVFAVGWFVNVNDYSLHSFYRDRLSRAYLMKGGAGTPPEHNDGQALSDTNVDRLPYHVINAALNVTTPAKEKKDKLRLPGRTAESFIFTRDHVGSVLTGYCRTTFMERSDPWLNLGTAMAISGAAFAPNMGNVTIRPLVFLLAMLNIRLGYWLQNPKSVKRGWLFARTKIPGRWLLFKELISTLDETDDYVNVSDGGHMDNLGIYELLRRRCRLIIAADAEADPKYQFEGLAVVCRLARIDMGIDISFQSEELDRIRVGRQYHAIGTVQYGDNVTGKIVYIKASMVKDNVPVYVDNYARRNEIFPHQTTLDQFFDEEQFECYRALGFQAAKSVFLPRIPPDGEERHASEYQSPERLSPPSRQGGPGIGRLTGRGDR